VGTIYGYAYVETRAAGVDARAGGIVSTCSGTPPAGFAPAVGYLVYVGDTSGPPVATTGANGYWLVTGVAAGRRRVYICPPGGPPGCLLFGTGVLGGMWNCTPSHEVGGGP